MYRALAICCTLTSLTYGAGYVVTQPGEVIVSPRSSTPKPLLFTFVTNQAGFDTEITISNTSQDSLGTSGQSGTCTLSYYGSTTGGGPAPAAQTTPSIPAGKQIVFTLSAGGGGVAATPGFQGYMIANCSFPLARGRSKSFPISGIAFAFSEDAQVLTLPRSTAQQSLLFPFVTNQAGYDSGIVIANSSLDPFGSAPTAGSCTLFYFGNTTGGGAAPAAQTTAIIPAGTQAVFTLSGGGSNGIAATPGFQGYIIASCRFSDPAGFAFVSDLGARNRSMGEAAELIPNSRNATPQPLLFSSVVGQNGVDTQISISNTTLDPFGTAPVSGTCTLNYFGVTAGGGGAPAAQTSTSIAAGDTLSFTVSGGGNHGIAATPGFKGYIIATCSFLARGWGFTAAASPADGGSFLPELVTLPRSGGSATLLFSAVNARSGNDTTITISNTSTDPFGTSAGAGPCTIYYFGDTPGSVNPPASQTSSSIAPGGQLSFSITTGNPSRGLAGTPGFRGYVIAGCGFPQARGLATTTAVAPPVGVFDTPTNGTTGLSGAFAVGGWALSTVTVANVALWREPVGNEPTASNGLVFMVNATTIAGSRPDVAGAFPGYPNNNYGWGAQILTTGLPGTNGLPQGNGTYKIHAIATDPTGLSTDIAGPITVSVNNTASRLPFGTIDTPTQGGTASGTAYVNFGWVLTPQPNIIPMDGSSITVYIDDQPVGHPTYNFSRCDVNFQGLRNSGSTDCSKNGTSPGPVGFFTIDTTKLTNGLHTIQWGVSDSGGNVQGIGSRFFIVQN